MNKFLKFFDFFFLARPILFFPGWATVLAGFAAAHGDDRIVTKLINRTYYFDFWNPDLSLIIFSFTCAMGACFILNQLKDIHTDKKNEKLFFLGNGHIKLKNAFFESVILLFCALFISFLINRVLFYFIVVFIIITGYLYNYKPFILKNKPILGLYANMAMGWIAFSIGWVLNQQIDLKMLVTSLPYLFFNTALYLLTTIPDIEGDAESLKITFPVKFGKDKTIVASVLFYFCGFFSSLVFKNEFLLLVSFLTLPFVFHLIKQKTASAAIFNIKAGLAIFALILCFKFPWFLLLLVSIFYITKIYYKLRFAIDYPNLRGM